MGNYTQDQRPIALTTPLGKDVLLLTSFSGQEEMSRLFSYDIEMSSENDAIDASQIVGQNVTFMVKFPDGSPRLFNGFVNRFAYCGRGDRLSTYRAQVVPWLWFLTRKSDCRIFQEMTIPDIVKKIFSELGFNDFEASEIKGKHPVWEYCVQYRETSFNFVSRLMEQEGIFYYFRHEDKKHTLVLSDQVGAYKDCVDKEVQFVSDQAGEGSVGLLTHWEHQYEFRTGKWTQTDYNFKDPKGSLLANVNTLFSVKDNSKYEFYDYPGEYEKVDEGSGYTKARMEEEEVSHNVVRGGSNCRSFSPGAKFKVKKHDCEAETGKKFAVTSTHHSATIGSSYETGNVGAGFSYRNSFTCIPDTVTFRPARLTPKPVIHGSQTAVVVGPAGEEIWPDEYGRVKVQFHWDREGKRDEKSSCWIRCAQTAAGKGWGAMFIPRVGQEVVVSYLEGDPDWPLVTGLVYNADQMPAYKLPDEKTKSYVKSNSTQGGEGFNEIRIDDKKDKEQIFIHSQRNMDTRVLNDSFERVVHDRHLVVGLEKDGSKSGDQIEQVFQDKHLNVKRNQMEQIEGNYQLMVGEGEAEDGGAADMYIEKKAALYIGEGGCSVIIDGDQSLKVEGQQSSTVTGDVLQSIKGNKSVTVAGDRMEKVASQSLTVDGDENVKVGMNHAMEAGMAIHIKAGMTLVLEAGMQLTLKAGASFIDIGPAGVSISGVPLVNINSGGAAGSGNGAKPKAPAAPEAPAKGDVQKAKPTKPTKADKSKTGHKSSS